MQIESKWYSKAQQPVIFISFAFAVEDHYLWLNNVSKVTATHKYG